MEIKLTWSRICSNGLDSFKTFLFHHYYCNHDDDHASYYYHNLALSSLEF